MTVETMFPVVYHVLYKKYVVKSSDSTESWEMKNLMCPNFQLLLVHIYCSSYVVSLYNNQRTIF